MPILTAALMLAQAPAIPVTQVAAAGATGEVEGPAEICAAWKHVEQKAKSELPMKIDPVTTMVSFSVDCDRKILIYNKAVNVQPSVFIGNWRSNMQTQWNLAACRMDQAMIDQGWISISRNRFPDGTMFVMTSNCRQKAH